MDTINNQSTFLISRYDHYYDSINNKGSFMVALSTFVLGGVVAIYSTSVNNAENIEIVNFLLALFLVVSSASLIMTLLAINPYTKSGNQSNEDFNSLSSFCSISKLKETSFINQYRAQSTKDIEYDLSVQVYQLAKGLDSKFFKLKIASYLMLAEAVLLCPLIYFLIIK